MEVDMAMAVKRGRSKPWKRVTKKPSAVAGLRVSRANKRADVGVQDVAGEVTVVIDTRKRGDSIGAEYETWLEAERLVERGLPFRAIERLAGTSGMTYERIKKLVRLTGATFARRR